MNTFGYKLIFCFENILRRFICEYSEDIDQSFIDEAIDNMKRSNVLINNGEKPQLADILMYLNLGQLLDVICTKSFRKKHENDVWKLNNIRNSAISLRNDIMHSRIVFEDEVNDLHDNLRRLLDAIKDRKCKLEFDTSITANFSNIPLCIPYINYPLGKDFNKLIGRDDDIKKIQANLKFPTPITIAGMGGLGKSALVLQLIEDIIVSPRPIFKKIFFMSFKDSFFDGEVYNISKPIGNYEELIKKLASIYEISIINRDLQIIEKEVFSQIFSEATLLILDNLETEIIKSNLNEFVNLAREYTRNYTKQSRLIITSRNGLGQIEDKYDLSTLNKENTLKLLSVTAEKSVKVNDEQWNWLNIYCEGNPLQIKTLGIVLKEASTDITTVITEYKSRNSSLSKKLVSQKEAFLSFCFDNTIVTLKKSDQILFTVLCDICSRIDIYQVNRYFMDFIIDHLELALYGVETFEPNNFTRLTLLYFDSNSCANDYKINMSALQYLIHSKTESRHYNKYDMISDTYLSKALDNLVQQINEIILHSKRIPTINDILSLLYMHKYNDCKHEIYLQHAFQVKPSLDSLIYYLENSQDILNNMHLINHLSGKDLNDSSPDNIKRQNRIIEMFVSDMLYNKTLPLFQLKSKFDMLNIFILIKKNKNYLSVQNKAIICKLLLKIKCPEETIYYLNGADDSTKFEVYSKLAEEIRKSGDPCERKTVGEYFSKCLALIRNGAKINSFEKCRFLLYYGKYLLKLNSKEAIEVLKQIDDFKVYNVMYLSFILESLIIRAEYYKSLGQNKAVDELVTKIKQMENLPCYNQLFNDKKIIFSKRIRDLSKTA